MLVFKTVTKIISALLRNSNWTEWNTIQGVIGCVISKSDEHNARLIWDYEP